MKLIKKLLPIATGLSTVAITAPIVASCKNSLNMDLGYSPSVSQHKEESFNTSQAVLEEYFNQAKNNLEIIIQDYIFDCASSLLEWKNNTKDNYQNKAAKYYASASNLSLNKQAKPKTTDDLYTISGTFVYNYSKTYTVEAKTESNDEYKSDVTLNINRTYHITNLTLNISKETTQEKNWWRLYLSTDSSLDWEVREITTTKTSQKATFKDGKTLTSGQNSSDESIYNKTDRSFYRNISWGSYYLKNVTLKTQ